MAYSDGTVVFQQELSLFKATHAQSKELEIQAMLQCHRRMETDWIHCVLYGFGSYQKSVDFQCFVQWIKDTYTAKKYDKLNLDGCTIGYELSLVRNTMKLLSNLCKFCDHHNALEGDYIPVKFFMLACVAREESLRTEVLKKMNVVPRSPHDREQVIQFFSFIKREIRALTKSNFNEYNIKYMMDKFMERVVLKYAGALFDESMRCDEQGHSYTPSSSFAATAATTTSNLRNKQQQQQQTGFSSMIAQWSKDYLKGGTDEEGEEDDPNHSKKNEKSTNSDSEDMNTDDDDDDDDIDIGVNSNGQATQKSTQQQSRSQEKKGVPLPQMYKPEYGSVQTAALAKRAEAVSYYAIIATLINFYMHHFYNSPLLMGLHYNPQK